MAGAAGVFQSTPAGQRRRRPCTSVVAADPHERKEAAPKTANLEAITAKPQKSLFCSLLRAERAEGNELRDFPCIG
jgi:hypothetical protein